ncbi:MAG: alkaline phosphatase D family protein [Alphaproteobacteria bacterium]
MSVITDPEEDVAGSYLGLFAVLIVVFGFIALLVWAGTGPLKKGGEHAGAPSPLARGVGESLPPGSAPGLSGASGGGQELAPATVLTRIAFGSGIDQERPLPILSAVIARKPQAFIMVGDAVRAHVEEPGTGAPVTSPLLIAAAYGALAENKDFKTFRSGLPLLGTWGGHDYGQPGAGKSFPYQAASKEAFLQFYGLSEGSERARRDGVYGAYVYGPEGSRVQVILLDTNSFRDGAVTLLGGAQWAWLEQQLIAAADVRLLVSPVPVLPETGGDERWAALPGERAQLFDVLRRTDAKNVVILSGNGEAGAIYKDERDLPYPLFEVASAGLSAPPAGAAAADPMRVDQAYTDENFGSVDIDWQARSVNLELRDKTGGLIRGVSAAIVPDEEPPVVQ